MRPRLSAAALRDLLEAVEFIARDNPDAAQRLRERLIAAADNLAEFPGLGNRLAGKLRVFSVPGTRYRLLYATGRAGLVVVRIYHGARQWPPASS